MALVVTMKEGHQVQVGDTTYTVAEVFGPENFSVVNEKTQQVHPIDIKEWVSVAKNVKFIAGIQNKDYGSWVKLLIKAPVEIPISEIRRD